MYFITNDLYIPPTQYLCVTHVVVTTHSDHLNEQLYNDVSNTTKLIMFIIVLGQHVSIPIESSSGPSMIQILT